MDNIITLHQSALSRKSAPAKAKPKRAKKPIRYLTGPQVEALVAVAKKTSRYPLRDATMILVAYRHGLRVSELIDLTWDRICFSRAEIFVERLKGSKSSMQAIEGDELRALRKLRRVNPNDHFVFVSERGGPLSPDSFQYLLKRCGEEAGLPLKAHPHMLRHGCGHYLVNAGVNTRTIQDYLGHRDLRHTERYTSSTRSGSGGFGGADESRREFLNCVGARHDAELFPLIKDLDAAINIKNRIPSDEAVLPTGVQRQGALRGVNRGLPLF